MQWMILANSSVEQPAPEGRNKATNMRIQRIQRIHRIQTHATYDRDTYEHRIFLTPKNGRLSKYVPWVNNQSHDQNIQWLILVITTSSVAMKWLLTSWIPWSVSPVSQSVSQSNSSATYPSPQWHEGHITHSLLRGTHTDRTTAVDLRGCAYVPGTMNYTGKSLRQAGGKRGNKDNIAVARSSLLQQHIRNWGQLVCVGERWASSLFFLRVLDGVCVSYFSNRGRSGDTTTVQQCRNGSFTY